MPQQKVPLEQRRPSLGTQAPWGASLCLTSSCHTTTKLVHQKQPTRPVFLLLFLSCPHSTRLPLLITPNSPLYNEPLPSRLGQSKLRFHATRLAVHTDRLLSPEMMSTALTIIRTLALKTTQEALSNIHSRPSLPVPQSLASSTRTALSLPPTT